MLTLIKKYKKQVSFSLIKFYLLLRYKETDVKLSDEKLANEFTTESDISYIRNIIRRLDDSKPPKLY